MRIAITANGPGETAGWVRPLVRELYAREPDADIYLFFVPDDYATGREAQTAREFFAQAHVYDPKTYVRVALGGSADGLPDRVDVVQYLGGDLLHAARLAKRLKGEITTYRFSRKRYASRFAHAFAFDEDNREELIATGISPERVTVVGNLAVDGALLEAQAPREADAPEDGVLFMPGSRRYEVEHLIPFFFAAALRMRAEDPALPIAFGISPFTPLDDVARAIEAGGDPRMYACSGRLVREGERAWLESLDGMQRVPVVRNALAAAAAAHLVVTIPGTKTIELAVLGKPMLTCTPLNAPELIVINGPLTYLDRIPIAGPRLKRAAVLAYAKRFTHHTQPNIDANESLIDELHGALSPGRVARVALERYADRAWLHEHGRRLAALYTEHVGAAGRMAAALLELPR